MKSYQQFRDSTPRTKWCPKCKAWVTKWHKHWTEEKRSGGSLPRPQRPS